MELLFFHALVFLNITLKSVTALVLWRSHKLRVFFFLTNCLFPFSVFIIITNNEGWVKRERIEPEEVKTCSNGADVADGTVLHF